MGWEQLIEKIENGEKVEKINAIEEQNQFVASEKLKEQLKKETNKDLVYFGETDVNNSSFYKTRINHGERINEWDPIYMWSQYDIDEYKNYINDNVGQYEAHAYESFGINKIEFTKLSYDDKVKYINNIKNIKARFDIGNADGISFANKKEENNKDFITRNDNPINFENLDLLNLNLKNHGFGELAINYHFDYSKRGREDECIVEIEKKPFVKSNELKELIKVRDSLVKDAKKKNNKEEEKIIQENSVQQKDKKKLIVFSYYDDVRQASNEAYNKLIEGLEIANKDYSEAFGPEKIENPPKYLHSLVIDEDEIQKKIESEKEKLAFFEMLEENDCDWSKISEIDFDYKSKLEKYTGKSIDKYHGFGIYDKNNIYGDIRKAKNRITTLETLASGKESFAKFLNHGSNQMNAAEINDMVVFLNQAIGKNIGDIQDKSLGFTNSANQADKFGDKCQNLVDNYYLAIHADEILDKINSINIDDITNNEVIPVSVKHSIIVNKENIVKNLTKLKANKSFIMDDFSKAEMNANPFSVNFDVDDPKTLVTLNKINKAFETDPNYKLDGLENDKAFKSFCKLGAARLANRAKAELETAEILLSECKDENGNYIDKNNIVFKDEKGKEVKLATEEGRKKALAMLLAKDEKSTLEIYDSTNPYLSCDVRNDGNMGWTKYKAQIDCDYPSLNLGELPKEPSKAKKIWHWIKKNIFRSAEGVKEVEEYNKAKQELEEVTKQLEEAAKNRIETSLTEFTDVEIEELNEEKKRLTEKFSNLKRSEVIQEMEKWEKMPSGEKVKHLNEYIKWKEIKEKWDNAPVEDRQKTRITKARSKDMLIERGIQKKIEEKRRLKEDVASRKEESIKIFRRDDNSKTKYFEKGMKNGMKNVYKEVFGEGGTSIGETGYSKWLVKDIWYGGSEYKKDIFIDAYSREKLGHDISINAETLYNKNMYDEQGGLDKRQLNSLICLYDTVVKARDYIKENLSVVGKNVVDGADMEHLNDSIQQYFNGFDLPNDVNKEAVIQERYKPIGEMALERMNELVSVYENALNSTIKNMNELIKKDKTEIAKGNEGIIKKEILDYLPEINNIEELYALKNEDSGKIQNFDNYLYHRKLKQEWKALEENNPNASQDEYVAKF